MLNLVMRKYLLVLSKVFVWLVVMVGFLHFITLSSDNSYALTPNWFSGDKNYVDNETYTAVAYSSPGFPVRIEGSSTEGRYALAWSINIGFALLAGASLAWLLVKKQRIGFIVATFSLLYLTFLLLSP